MGGVVAESQSWVSCSSRAAALATLTVGLLDVTSGPLTRLSYCSNGRCTLCADCRSDGRACRSSESLSELSLYSAVCLPALHLFQYTQSCHSLCSSKIRVTITTVFNKVAEFTQKSTGGWGLITILVVEYSTMQNGELSCRIKHNKFIEFLTVTSCVYNMTKHYIGQEKMSKSDLCQRK